MPKSKRKLTAVQRKAKKWRLAGMMTVFINGKQKCVKRPPTINGISVEEFIRHNADPVWLHQNGMWESLVPFATAENQ